MNITLDQLKEYKNYLVTVKVFDAIKTAMQEQINFSKRETQYLNSPKETEKFNWTTGEFEPITEEDIKNKKLDPYEQELLNWANSTPDDLVAFTIITDSHYNDEGYDELANGITLFFNDWSVEYDGYEDGEEFLVKINEVAYRENIGHLGYKKIIVADIKPPFEIEIKG
jgi:hypothetical protein